MSNANKPVFTLNMDEKIYLAVAKKDLDKLSFVYTLACLKQNKTPNSYNVFATQEIHTFKSKTYANVYYETISQAVEFNENDAVPGTSGGDGSPMSACSYYTN